MSSRCIWGSTRFCFKLFAKFVWVSASGMFVYNLAMSNKARWKWGGIGVWFSLCIRSLEFSMLNALGGGLTFCVNS